MTRKLIHVSRSHLDAAMLYKGYLLLESAVQCSDVPDYNNKECTM